MPGIIDRYILWSFFKTLLMAFISLTGLYIVLDAFTNTEGLIQSSSTDGLQMLWLYYGPRALQFFDWTGPLMMLLAAMYALTALMRTNELTAITAGGVSKGRIIRPLIWAAAGVSLLGVLNREAGIPAVRDKLTRTAKDWRGEKPKSLRPIYDYRTDIFLSGRQTVAIERKIVLPHFRLPGTLSKFGHQIVAESAHYRNAEAGRPAGYLFENVVSPQDLEELPTATLEGRPIVLSPRDNPWLGPGQCFVVTDVTFEQLAGGSYWRQLSSSAELIAALRNPSLDLGNDARVLIHARLVQPLLDVTLFLLGLPLIVSRDNRNVFVAAGLCLALVAVFFITVLICHALGTTYLVSPVVGAWLPLMIFAPLSYTACAPLWK